MSDVVRRDSSSMGRYALYFWSLFCILLCSFVATKVLTASAGEPVKRGKPQLKNPYHGKPDAIAEGKMLFEEAGCPKCHGTDASGGDGPNLTDNVWIIDGTDKTLFRTITKGRPKKRGTSEVEMPPAKRRRLTTATAAQGPNRVASDVEMPSWEDSLEPEQIWKIIAWIRSIYKGDPQKIVWKR